MKSMKIIATVLIWVVCGGVATAAEGVKIGVINVSKVLDQAPQAKAATAQLEKEFAPRNTEMLNIQRTLQMQEEKMSRDGDVMSAEERRNLERDIIASRRDAKRIQEEFRDDLNIRKQEELNKLQRQVVEAINEIARQDNFDLILGDGVLYAKSQIDVTNKLLEHLEKLGAAADKDGAAKK
ncbi:MAG: hypothetical protein A2V90_02455 [Gammaproteobacteria bacterium RBG_16_57_12]|nr:MAG: hypothetical protein A2V90_02455 [Gammaproteobacteria bacterium RBG_16_57_12]